MLIRGNHSPYGSCETSEGENPAPTRSKFLFASAVEGSMKRDIEARTSRTVVVLIVLVQSMAPVQLARRRGSCPSAPGLSKMPLYVRISVRSFCPYRTDRCCRSV